MEPTSVTHSRGQATGNPRLSPAFFRQINTALAARDIEQIGTLIDRAGVNEPALVARALVTRDKAPFLGRLLKILPEPQQMELAEAITSLIAGRQLPIAPAQSVPHAAASAWQAEDERAFLADIGVTPATVSSILLAATDMEARQLYPLLFQRKLTLLSLQFDHAAGTSATSALHLRHDGKTTVFRPEWVRGKSDPKESPVLYAANLHSASHVLIKATIRRSSSLLPDQSVELRALEGGVLGVIDPMVVAFGTETELTVDVPLTHLAVYGPAQTDVAWRWEYRIDQGDWRFLARTYHCVYCTPRQPNVPWDLSAPDRVANPWTAALDIACQAANLAGIADEMDGLAAGLCELLNPGGLAPNPFRLAYTVNDSGDRHYNGPNDTVDLSAFLERAGGRDGNGELVNCDDCAGLVVTLANLLGCDLYEQYISTSAMHPVIPLGEGRWWANSVGFLPSFGATNDGILTYHNVAWRGNNANDAIVFDITWLLNMFGNPDDPEQPHPELRSPWYPYGERFKVTGALDYIGRLHPTSGWYLGAKTRRGIS